MTTQHDGGPAKLSESQRADLAFRRDATRQLRAVKWRELDDWWLSEFFDLLRRARAAQPPAEPQSPRAVQDRHLETFGK